MTSGSNSKWVTKTRHEIILFLNRVAQVWLDYSKSYRQTCLKPDTRSKSYTNMIQWSGWVGLLTGYRLDVTSSKVNGIWPTNIGKFFLSLFICKRIFSTMKYQFESSRNIKFGLILVKREIIRPFWNFQVIFRMALSQCLYQHE